MYNSRYHSRHRGWRHRSGRRRQSPFGGQIKTPEEIRQLSQHISQLEAAELKAANFDAQFDDVWSDHSPNESQS